MKSKMLGLFVAMVAVALVYSPADAGDCRGVLQIQSQAVYAQPVQFQYAAPVQFQQSAYLVPQNVQFQTDYGVPAAQLKSFRLQHTSHHGSLSQRSQRQRAARFVAPPQPIVLRQEVPVPRGRNTQIGFINFGR